MFSSFMLALLIPQLNISQSHVKLHILDPVIMFVFGMYVMCIDYLLSVSY